MKSSQIIIRWVCENKSIDWGVESSDRCGEEFEAVGTLLEWEEKVSHIICPFCGSHLNQITDIANVIKQGKDKVKKGDDIIPMEVEPEDKLISDSSFVGFGYN